MRSVAILATGIPGAFHRGSHRFGLAVSSHRFGLAVICVVSLALAESAESRAIRVDGTLQSIALNVADDTFNDGSTGPLPLQSYELDINGLPDFSAALPFSINFFGTTYSDFYINENGNVTFGAPFAGRPGNTDLANTGMAILAPFFADTDMFLGGRIFNGFFPFEESIAITWTNARYFGQLASETGNDMQIVIRDMSGTTGVAGDFNLEFNYRGGSGGMLWETGNRDGGSGGFGGSSARVGFYDGFGTGFEIAGSGVPGALLGSDCQSNPTALDCNNYFYQFRNGLPYQGGRALIQVPEPGTGVLLVMGLVLLMGTWRSRSQPLKV